MIITDWVGCTETQPMSFTSTTKKQTIQAAITVDGII